ncbi:hypothetical protein M9H77_11509 [Catharanthus roseus]|uniref:Uncharacterized protein n=1 Tax=Catharanthus roseus TaxID=4058 RepID=A0ACC0BEU3_CATRO|nr:hypothetical protein M9H77_11509 [Catharanthus roseus]
MEYTSILDDPKPRFSIDCGDDPSYALFLSNLKNDGSSYVLEANEKTGLTKPLKYMENDPNGEGENDLDSHAKTEAIEFQSNYDCDYKLFFENMRLEGSYVIYQYKNGVSVVYDRLIFLNSHTEDNVVSKKRKYTGAIRHATTSKGINVNNHCGSPQQTMCSKFRVQILEILRKPYDKEEHERLMQEITKQKPQHKHRDLRSGGIEEAVAANNDLKQLNLLRGFFFWLGKISRSEGQKRIPLMMNHSFHRTTKNVLMCSQKDPKPILSIYDELDLNWRRGAHLTGSINTGSDRAWPPGLPVDVSPF